MTAAPGTPLDTRDMVGVHRALKRALVDAGGQIAAVAPGDLDAANRLGSYLSEVFWLIHIHHVGEDHLLYPLLVDRAPTDLLLYRKMHEQHVEVTESLEPIDAAIARFRETGSADDGAELSIKISAVAKALEPHLGDEEAAILPLAAIHLSPPEWGAMPQHAFANYQGERPWLILGLVLESMDPDVRAATLTHFPPPVSQMWTAMGESAFQTTMAQIR